MIKVSLNGNDYRVDSHLTIGRFLSEYYPDFDLVIVNTVLNPDLNYELKNGDRVVAFKKGSIPDGVSLKDLMFARQPEDFTDKLQGSTVGIAGLGGLGSVVGENLVRAGVGRLVVVDFDIVEPSNINRQRYFINQIGRYKVNAFKENMKKISPFTEIEGYIIKVSRNNVDIFEECQIIAECFDDPSSKAELVSAIRDRLPDKIVVASSGIAGFGSEKSVVVRRISDKIYVVGDGESEVKDRIGLVATRVGIAASIQSHLIVRLILGLEK